MSEMPQQGLMIKEKGSQIFINNCLKHFQNQGKTVFHF